VATTEVINPATEQVLAVVELCDAEAVDEAVAGCLAAQKAWAARPPADRAAALRSFAAVVDAHIGELAALEVANSGHPLAAAEWEAAHVRDVLNYYSGAPERLCGKQIPVAGGLDVTFSEPIGVVGVITPWNFPMPIAVWAFAPALAAGNAVVLKPAEWTPLTTVRLGELAVEAGLPPDLLRVLPGRGSEAGRRLVTHPDVRKIVFTGSTEVGTEVMALAARQVKRVTLELGGKSPNIFFSDVMAANDDYQDKALEGFTMFALNQGEVCTCPSRSLIQADIYDEFLALAAIRTKAVRQGDPLDTETMIGAQASNDQLEKILSYIEIGKSEGARVISGGERADLGGDLSGGYYVQPTIFAGDNAMRIFQEEIFGPVVSVTSFNDYDDAIRIANDTLYGLGAGVWSRNGNIAYRAGRDIKAGRVWTNCYHAYPAHAAFGGYKQSGIGRENHKMMLDHYQQTKNLLVSYSNKAQGFF
jgi:aldehyde dehydrogenase